MTSQRSREGLARPSALGRLAIASICAGLVASCGAAVPTPRPDPAAAQAEWLRGNHYNCTREAPASQTDTQWQCERTNADGTTYRVTVDATDTEVSAVSGSVDRPLRLLAASDWETFLDAGVLGTGPYSTVPDLRAWLLRHRAETNPTQVKGVRVTVSGTGTTTTVILYGR